MRLFSNATCLRILSVLIMLNYKILGGRLLFLALLWLPVASIAQPKVMVLGDSLSAGYGINYQSGWVNLLEQQLKPKFPDAVMVNASISGDTSTGALARLPQLLRTHKPDLVIIEIGGNDGLRGLTPKRLKQNISTMVELIEANSKALLIQMRIPLNYGKKYTEKFEGVYTEVSEDFDITLAPFILEEFVTDPEYMQADRIHPKVNAQPLIVEKILPFILGELSVEKPEAEKQTAD